MAAIKMDKEMFQQVTAQEKPVLVDFSAPWCGYCRRIDPAYDRLAEQREKEMIVAKVNIDEEPELAQQEQIEVIPTLVLYRNAKALGSIVAPESKAQIDEWIERLLK